MTNNEILKADMLDILFEHRNKQYGAYVLRRQYNHRLATAIAIAFSGVLVVVLFSVLGNDTKNSNPWNEDGKNNQVVVSSVDIPRPVDPEPPKPVEKQQVEQADYQTIKIVKDKEVVEPLTTIADVSEKAISDIDIDGDIPADLNKAITSTPAIGTGEHEQHEKESEGFEPYEVAPSFPGGPAALALFFSRNINPPDNLEPGEKKVVMVKFIVNADGTVTQTEIIQSSGENYEREVLKAFKRMPKWNAAIQNGRKIAVAFTQPVTFIGQEE